MLERLGQRPLLVALLLALAAQTLFSLHLTRPGGIVFDETHYVSAARILLDLDRPTNVEHPLVGKALIASGIALFGDNPLGWRAMSTLAGTATVMGVFAILMLLFARVRVAAFGAVLVMLNQMVFVQSRVGMLDTFLAAFVVGAVAALLWAMRAPRAKVARRVALAGVLLGLAVGTKWAAIPYCALAGLAVIVVRWRTPDAWPGLGTLPLLILLAATSIVTYLATFAPAFFYRTDPLTLGGLIPLQFEIYRLQTFVLASHTYQSDWWSWPLMLRPIWYYYELDAGVQRGVLLVGNPAILWGGLAALGLCVAGWLRQRDWRLLGVAALWAGSLGIYAVIPKSLGFFYYYHLSSIFLCVAIAAAYAHFGRGRWGDADQWFLIPAAGLFVYFYPILSGAPLTNDQAFLNWTWFPNWV
ncbi:phospholipid carrier-dependent glycosyltransferase [Sphingomonas sp. AX6]|uniref:phospholipid carrier-dependent glycosyltransferase n=1 Tax=Sphingomonas sp. AX6 TaxID=2653171 RepID=UPI0012F27EE3|nr:phospholipid carrier-dependent glycosyltransferase [Sphingomonas sp. AX6]VXC73426.1 Dolichyl-phosphate-mannose--protein mannosyltransferase [Sphingomonas sp. AX6]